MKYLQTTILCCMLYICTQAQKKIFLYSNTTDTTQGYYKAFTVANATSCVIICPGGGYSHVSVQHEGIDAATWCNKQGINAYVLHYRVSTKTEKMFFPSQLNDVQALYSIVKKQHKKIGIMGFSAGGHLAGMAATDKKMKFKFAALIYPVISSDSSFWHRGSFRALLGDDYRNKANENFSVDKRITKKTAPIFFVHCKDDRVVPFKNSVVAYEQSVQFQPQSKLLIYEKGGHGFGMRTLQTDAANWSNEMQHWLQQFIQL
jgi:acetyl esterase/lipase